MSDNVVKRVTSSNTDYSPYPDIHLYDDVRKESFWILEVVEKEFGIDHLMSSQIAEILVEKFRISRSSRAVGSTLGKAVDDGFVNKKGKKNEFKLMEKGRIELYLTRSKNPGVFYIEPGKPFSSKMMLFNDILSNMMNKVWICDPYIGVRLLDILHALDASIEIRIMTIQVQNGSAFRRMLIDFEKEHTNTEVRIAPSGELHDRYILSDNGMWLVGHSLKDLGSKESFVVKLDEDIRKSMELVFANRWNVSKKLT